MPISVYLRAFILCCKLSGDGIRECGESGWCGVSDCLESAVADSGICLALYPLDYLLNGHWLGIEGFGACPSL